MSISRIAESLTNTIGGKQKLTDIIGGRQRLTMMMLVLMLVLFVQTAGAETKFRPCRTFNQGVNAESVDIVQEKSRMTLSALSASSSLYIGDRRQLVVLAAFADEDFAEGEEGALEKWERLFNAEGLDEEPYIGSVHDYFYDQSYGQFRLTFDLQYVRVGGAKSKYASTRDDDENSQYLVYDVMDSLSLRTIDWSLYDWNGDNKVEQIIIVFAGLGMSDGGDENTIWPHQMWLSRHKGGSPYIVGSSYTIDSYCTINSTGKKWNPFGTVCHEYTHCFGFPDFYSGPFSFVKKWDLMDQGNFNGDGCRPCGYSAHERWLMGWLTPRELTSATSVTGMQALCDENEAYIIRSEGCDSEYYIVENRQQHKWDSQLPGNGLLVFHIDYDYDIWNFNVQTPANSLYEQHYVLMHANDDFQSPAGWAYPYDTNNQLTNISVPQASLWHDNSDGTQLMSKPITGMSVENEVASFTFENNVPTDIREITQEGSYEVLYELGHIIIVRYEDGTVRKVLRK